MMHPWLVMCAIGLLTFMTRLSFIALLERWQAPAIMKRALGFVPVTVLTAIIVPELVLHDGMLDLALTNPRLLAGGIAIIVAWKTKNVVWTIVTGMGALLLLQKIL